MIFKTKLAYLIAFNDGKGQASTGDCVVNVGRIYDYLLSVGY